MKPGSYEFASRLALSVDARPVEVHALGTFALRWAVAALGALILAVGTSAPAARAQTPSPEPLAEVNGVPITAKDVERSLGAKLSQLEEQIYTLKRNEIDALVAQRLLEEEAAKRGVTRRGAAGRGGDVQGGARHRKGDRRLLQGQQGSDAWRRDRRPDADPQHAAAAEADSAPGRIPRVAAVAGEGRRPPGTSSRCARRRRDRRRADARHARRRR